MRFYLRINNRKNDVIEGIKSTLWQKFDQANLRLQYTCAQWLERKTAHFSRLNWIVVLFTFIVFTGSCSIYLIVTSFSENTTKNITVIPITKPTNSIPLIENDIELNTIISKVELEKITLFRRYMDSLGRSLTGKKSMIVLHNTVQDFLTVLQYWKITITHILKIDYHGTKDKIIKSTKTA